MDVVYNHTNEADDKYPYTTSFRGIDNKVSHKSGDSHLSLFINEYYLYIWTSKLCEIHLQIYYMLDPNNQLLNYSGCGNFIFEAYTGLTFENFYFKLII